MKRSFLFFLFVFAVVANAAAQYYTNQNKVWAFGKNAGLDFNSGAPVPIATAIDQQEGCASVCGSAGNLLFYTDGKKIFRNTGAVMFSGSPVVPYTTLSASQAALIVPFWNDTDRYYVFSLEGSTSGFSSKLAFSVVDMSLAGGLGDVPTVSAGIGIEDSLGEKMIAIKGNRGIDNSSIWVLTHKKDSALFLAYEVNALGLITEPVISAAGTLSGLAGYALGVIKASPDGRKIVSQSYGYSSVSPRGTELFDFDASTGMVSNCIVLDSLTSQYGAEFSPDNTKLYVQESISSNLMKIAQYDLSSGDAATIRASKTDIATITTANVTDMRLAPDGKIYMFGTDDSTKTLFLGYSRFLDCITSPNSLGTACGYVPHVIQLPAGSGMRAGLPNLYVSGATGTVAINDKIENPKQIAFFPNPATSELTITSPEKITNLSISNTLGQLLYRQRYNNETVKVDVSALPAGIYFIRVNNVSVTKFVKE